MQVYYVCSDVVLHLQSKCSIFIHLKTTSYLQQQSLEEKMNINTLLTTKEAAKYLSVSKAFLERDRWAGARIPFLKVGSRAVRYRQSDLDIYLDSRVRTSTSDQGVK